MMELLNWNQHVFQDRSEYFWIILVVSLAPKKLKDGKLNVLHDKVRSSVDGEIRDVLRQPSLEVFLKSLKIVDFRSEQNISLNRF